MRNAREGFHAYEEIENLAKLVFPNDEVNIQASIFGNSYEIIIGGRDVISGTSQSVRATLLNVQNVQKAVSL